MYLRWRFPTIAPNLSPKACQTYGYMLSNQGIHLHKLLDVGSLRVEGAYRAVAVAHLCSAVRPQPQAQHNRRWGRRQPG